MVRINTKALYLYPTCFAIGSGALAGAGWLGAHLVRIIVPSIVPTAHAVAAGLWAPACLATWLLASAINKKGGPVNHSIGVFGGYLAAIATANMMGYAVSIGPFVSLASLSFPIAAGVALIMPIGIALITITNVGRRVRDYILHAD